MLSDDELVEQILLGNENAAEELINAIIHLFYVTVGGIALIWKKQKT